MGKALSGELSYPCDRSCYGISIQEKDKTCHTGSLGSSLNIGSLSQPESDSSIGKLLETAIQQSPIYYIKHG